MMLISAPIIASTPISANFLHYLAWRTLTNAKIETGFIQNRGASIFYTSYGRGEPIVLLHGGLGNKLSWFSQLPWLVNAGRRVVLIDTRGHGDSTHGDAELSYQIFAEDTLKVMDKLGIYSADIVGWSDGGIIALLLGLEAPHRVRRIVAISANFHPSGLIPELNAPESAKNKTMLDDIKDSLRNWWAKPNDSYETLAAELNKLWRTEPQLTHSDLHSIASPTLVIAGENDVIELAHSGELAQMLPYGKIEIILGAGHDAPITHAEKLKELIASFLGIELI